MTPRPSKSVLEIATAGNARELGQRIRRSRTPATLAQARKDLIPSESQSQQAIFRYFLGNLKGDRRPGIGLTPKYPELIDLYAIPNQGARSGRNGARMKAEGMFKSIPDMCLPAPKGPFHGLYLEGKRPGEKLRPDQEATAARLRRQGYCVATWQGAEEGIRAILWYLELGPYREPGARPNSLSIEQIRETLHHTLELRLKDVTR